MHDPRIWLRRPATRTSPWDTACDAPIRSTDEILSDLRAAKESGAKMVRLSGGDPSDVVRHIQLAKSVGVGTSVAVPASWLPWETTGSSSDAAFKTLIAAGLSRVTLVVAHPDPELHDEWVHINGDGDRVAAALEQGPQVSGLQIRLVVPVFPGNVDHLGEIMQMAAKRELTVHLIESPTERLTDAQAGLAAQRAWRGVRHPDQLILFGFRRPPPPTGPATFGRVDAISYLLRAAGVPLPDLLHGATLGSSASTISCLRDAGGLASVARRLAAAGCPVHDAPACLGGRDRAEGPGDYAPSCARCPHRPLCPGVPSALNAADQLAPPWDWTPPEAGARILIAIPYISDRVTTLSTIPGLARDLEAQGADVRVDSVWHRPWNMHEPTGPRTTHSDYTYASERIATARQFSDAFLQRLDPTDADLVIVPGLDNAAKILQNPKLPPHARVLALDFHMLEHIEALHARWLPPGSLPANTHWWPSERLQLISAFQGYSWTYRSHGIPVSQVAWRRYPLCQDDFPAGAPAVESTHILGTGNQFRDWENLRDAAITLGLTEEQISVFTSQRLDDWGPLNHRGQTSLLRLYAEMQNARFVVVPLKWDPDRAAGITNFQLAFAAGRPVISTRIPAAVDHLEHGRNALLVDVGDVDGLTEAMRALIEDDELLNKLAQGALETARENGTEEWARQLLHGTYPTPEAAPGTTT